MVFEAHSLFSVLVKLSLNTGDAALYSSGWILSHPGDLLFFREEIAFWISVSESGGSRFAGCVQKGGWLFVSFCFRYAAYAWTWVLGSWMA